MALGERPEIEGLSYVNMRMAGVEEVLAFVEQNRMRSNPKGI